MRKYSHRLTTHTHALSRRPELQRRVWRGTVGVHAGLLLRLVVAQRHVVSRRGVLPARLGIPSVVCGEHFQPQRGQVGANGLCALSQWQRVPRGGHVDPHRMPTRCELRRCGAVGVRARAVCGGLVLPGRGAKRQQQCVVHDGQRGLRRPHRVGHCAVSRRYG